MTSTMRLFYASRRRSPEFSQATISKRCRKQLPHLSHRAARALELFWLSHRARQSAMWSRLVLLPCVRRGHHSLRSIQLFGGGTKAVLRVGIGGVLRQRHAEAAFRNGRPFVL